MSATPKTLAKTASYGHLTAGHDVHILVYMMNKRGRPAAAKQRTVNIHIRCTPAEHAAWVTAAESDGRTVSDWIRRALRNDRR